MDIACPICEAVYEIDDATVGTDGRKVRCAACSTVWRVFRSEPDASLQDTSLKEYPVPPMEIPLSEQELAEKAVDWNAAPIVPDDAAPSIAPVGRAKWVKGSGNRPVAKSSVSRAALATVAAVAIVVGAGIHQRASIVQHVPQSARLFAMLRMPVNLRGIEIKGVASRILDDNGVSVLVVDGDLINATARKVDVPRLRFAVLSPAGQEIYVWSAQADRTSLQPGESLNFRRRLAAPPGDARDVSVRFVTKADITAGIK